jgi:hypothetical protein
MTLQRWYVIATVLYAVFGLGLLAIPAPFMQMYGVTLDAGGQMMARILGSALLSLAALFYWQRNQSAENNLALNRVSFGYNVVDFFVVLAATLGGTMNAMGWGPVILHVVLAAGFGYFLFGKGKPAA